MTAQSDAGRYRQELEEAGRFIREGDDFLVVSHLSPDGDAISSTAAIGLILNALGKKYTLINEGRTPEKFVPLLAGQSIIDFSKDAPTARHQRVISVDCADRARLGKVLSLIEGSEPWLNIDHHPTNDAYGTVNLLKPDAAAAVEIIHDLVEVMGIEWTKPLATCIYAGLLTDTGGFRYPSTTPAVMAIAEKMLRHGAQGAALAGELLEKMSYAQVMLLKEALSTLTFSPDRKLAWVTVSIEMMNKLGASEEDTEGLVNIPRNVDGVEVGMMFKQKDADTVKVSLRSAGKVNVAELAKSLGGGGHVLASGCTVRGTLEQAVQRLTEAVNAKL